MKTVAIVGAGWMTQPLVDYLADRCGYRVIVANRTLAKAETVVAGKENARAVRWSAEDPGVLDDLMKEADLAISMVPKPVHIHIARACLRHGRHMLTTAYEIPELVALDGEAREKGVLILNELGEVPGIDHFGTQLVLDAIRKEGGRVISLDSYGSGLPAFEFNRNPLGYKFSWDPRTVFVAAQTPGAYLRKGKVVSVPGDKLFERFWLVDIEGVGTFESYANKDVRKYVEPFGLPEDVSFYRGLLRFPGYCNNMRHIVGLGMADAGDETDYTGLTYRQFTAGLIGVESSADLERRLAAHLGVDEFADVIHLFRWLGFFEDEPITISRGARVDVLLSRMLERMSYEPDERDMILLHVSVLAELPGGRRERRLATMRVEGTPSKTSAMSRAVALPAAIAAKLVLEGEVEGVGALMPPTMPGLYPRALAELEEYGYRFERQTVSP